MTKPVCILPMRFLALTRTQTLLQASAPLAPQQAWHLSSLYCPASQQQVLEQQQQQQQQQRTNRSHSSHLNQQHPTSFARGSSADFQSMVCAHVCAYVCVCTYACVLERACLSVCGAHAWLAAPGALLSPCCHLTTCPCTRQGNTHGCS